MRYEFRRCWACHRLPIDRPAGWGGPWLIERAHIVSSPRREDRRAVVMLCSLCHRRQHGESVAGYEHVPQLEVGHLLELKRAEDAGWYDRKFLQANCTGRLPRVKVLPAWFTGERLLFKRG